MGFRIFILNSFHNSSVIFIKVKQRLEGRRIKVLSKLSGNVDCGERHVEGKVHGSGIPRLAVAQSRELLAITVEKLDMEPLFGVKVYKHPYIRANVP